MKEHSRLLNRPWILLVAATVFITVHVIFFSHLWHAGVSLAVVSGLVVLVIAKHLGLLGPLYALFRRRTRT